MSRAADEAARQGSAALGGIRDGAEALGGQAKERASEYVEGGVRAVTQHIEDFAQAIRAASDELSQKDQTMAAQLVRQAAGGLESLSRSVSGTNMDDIIDSVRRFGRSNPAALIGGAVLAGLALGRFARASSQNDQGDWRQGGMSGQGGYSGQGSGFSGRSGSSRGGQYGGGSNAGMSPRPYSGGSSLGGGYGSASGSSGLGGSPSQSQGYAGGGMQSESTRPTGPSSDTDESVASSSGSTGGLGSSSISTGGSS